MNSLRHRNREYFPSMILYQNDEHLSQDKFGNEPITEIVNGKIEIIDSDWDWALLLPRFCKYLLRKGFSKTNILKQKNIFMSKIMGEGIIQTLWLETLKQQDNTVYHSNPL